MSGPHEPSGHERVIDLAFDIANPSPGIRFLGLVDNNDIPGHTLTGLFDWTCHACGAVSRDTVVVMPQQEFPAEWSCSGCSRATRVQFRARAGAEWITQHTLAVAGGAREGIGPQRAHKDRRKTLVWLAILVLAAGILMGGLNLRRLSLSSASPQEEGSLSKSTPSGRLPGCWVSQTGDHAVYFSLVDPTSREGTYTVVSRNDRQAHTVRFKVVTEEPAGEQLVIRVESGDLSKESLTGADPDADHADVTLCIPVHGQSMTRISICDGEPVMTVYRKVGLLDAP